MSNYVGIVNLYDGIFIGHGNSMTASVYVRTNKDELVVDATITNVFYSGSIPAGGRLSSPPGFNGL